MRHPVRIVFTLLLTLASACSLLPAPATPDSATPELTAAGGIDSAATELAATRLAAVEETMAAFTAIAQNPPTVLAPSETALPPTSTATATTTPSATVAATVSATASATSTTVPSPTPVTATLTPDPNSPTANGKITSFTVTPNEGRLDRGQVVTLAWTGAGLDATICVTYESTFSDGCQQASASGTLAYTLRTQDPVANHWADFELRVNGDISSEARSIRVLVKCFHAWFQDGLSEWCPTGTAQQTNAIAQPFEKGYAIYYQSIAYLFFNEPGNPYRTYGALPASTADLSSLRPPADRYRPAPELGSLWMGLVTVSGDVRTRLGWATGPGTAYSLSTQCARTPDLFSPCYYSTPDAGTLAVLLGTIVSPGSGGAVSIAEGTFVQIYP